MEGPSIHLAAEQLRPFVGRRVTRVSGNSRIGIERFRGKTLKDIFAWGKHLVFQFDTFALRVHFMLWGTFAATVKGTSVTGDYRRSGPPRLVLNFANGEITIWSASLKLIEDADARCDYDFTADIMSGQWDPKAAFRKVRAFPREENRRCPAGSDNLRRRRQHHQERSALPHQDEPVSTRRTNFGSAAARDCR